MKSDCPSYADVILSLHLPYSYTYKVPTNITNIKVGQRVVVQLRSRIYSAIVVNLHDNINPATEHSSTMKYILDIIDDNPIVTPKQIKFFKWISDYYVSYIGDVLTVALPASFRLKSETMVTISPYFNSDISDFDEKELQIFNLIVGKDKISLEDLKTNLEAKDVLTTINKLIKKDVFITDEELYSRYRPKKELFIALNEEYRNQENLKSLLQDLDANKRTQPQSQLILKYLSLIKTNTRPKKNDFGKDNLSTLNTMLKKGIFVRQSYEVSRLKSRIKTADVDSIVLNTQQQEVFNTIIDSWNDNPITLIHGVTGSGKTEVYIKLIDKVVSGGGQVLFLLPEIAITMQLINRLEKYFGDKAVVYNSKFSMLERAEIWHRTMMSDNSEADNDTPEAHNKQKFQIIVGSRSAVFLPFTDLQLVIIDEEHDTSFKQTEPVPHYNGRDCALYLAKLFGAKTVLGSATPNVETYKLALDGKYQLLELTKQYFDLPLPRIELVDMKSAIKNKSTYGIFSKDLIDAIDAELNNNRQVLIFQNRRGYAPHIECNVCGYIPKCPSCDVSLVFHKDTADLQCHYCGYHTPALSACPQCESHALKIVGSGTQKIEEELALYFPKAKIKRMDLDSTRSKDAYTDILNDFSSKKIDILCGTQIITKGLDFDNVSLVGVIGTDTMLHYPDFRAFERAFQILTQVSGRAGRRNNEGRVLIQTFEKDNMLMQDVVQRNYRHMYDIQIKERQMMNFPPFCRMIKLTLLHRDKEFLTSKSFEYASRLRTIFGSRLFGPQEPIIARIKNYYAMEIWLKIEKSLSYASAKQRLREYNEEFLSLRVNSQLRISIDVDPV